jgi:NAD(P)-dependent dehydrogenase (short-subunit alcohol dehydrogenase family)
VIIVSRQEASGQTGSHHVVGGRSGRAGVARDTVAGRMAQPADVAGVVSLFAAPEAAWLTGQYVLANGRFRYS